MDSQESVFKNLIWKFGERFLAQLISLIVSMVLARLLLPSEYGVVSLVLVFITFADVFISSGFSTSLIQKKDADETDFSTIFYCSLAVSILIYLLLYIAAPYIAAFYEQPTMTAIMRVFCLRLPIGAYNSIQHAYVSRTMQFKKFFFSTLVGTLVSGVVGIALAYAGYGAWAIVAQYLTNSIVDSIVLSFTIKWRPKLLFSWQAAKSLMSYGWKVLAADFSGTFFDQLRSLIIGKVYTTADLAYYNKGKQIPAIFTDNVSSAAMSVLFPALSNQADRKEQVKEMLRKTIQTLSYIIYPMAFGISAVASSLVLVLLGENWTDATPFLQILSIASAVNLISNTSLQTIKAVGRSDLLLRLEFIKKPVYVILLVVGVKINVLAVAVTMLIYAFYSMMINGGSLKQVINYSYKEQLSDIGTPLGLSLVMFGVVYLVSLVLEPSLICLFVQIVVGVITYVVLSIVTKNEIFIELKNRLIKKG